MENNHSNGQPEKRYNNLAIISFALALAEIYFILSLFWFPLYDTFFWLATLMMSIISLFQIHKQKEIYKGRWMPVTTILLVFLALISLFIYTNDLYEPFIPLFNINKSVPAVY